MAGLYDCEDSLNIDIRAEAVQLLEPLNQPPTLLSTLETLSFLLFVLFLDPEATLNVTAVSVW